jgi:zinc protease
MSKRLLIFVFLIAILCWGQTLVAQSADSTEYSFNPNDSIPLNPAVTYGKLDNGITYYILENHKPEKRAELRLVVNAGSILENDNQQGLAHFTEHMAFNGTKNFKKQELIDYLESIGMKFGPDLNAYTSFDETVYMLQVPTDSAEIMKKAFQILEDWAHQLTLDSTEIDKERGVIEEEWRLGRGADARMRDKQFPIIFKGSRYADRLPIGKIDIIENFKYDTLRKFYHDWYRPDLQAVIAIGDFDKDSIKSLIEEHFAKIPMPKNAPVRKEYDVPNHSETLYAIAADPEAARTMVSIYYKMPREEKKTVADNRRADVEGLVSFMLMQRINELAQQADPPIVGGFAFKVDLLRTESAFMMAALVNETGVDKGLEAILREARRAKQYGFTESELERQKAQMLRMLEWQYNERDKTESRQLASQYAQNYLTGEPVPSPEYMYQLDKKQISEVTLDDVNGLLAQWMQDESRVIAVNMPEKDGLEIPTEEELQAIFNKVESEEITAYKDEVSDEPLVKNPPEPSQIENEEYIKEIETYHWALKNGVQVVLKPTDFKNDEVLMRAFSPGGTSLYPDDEDIPAGTAASIVNDCGIAELNKVDLDKRLADKRVSVMPSIGDDMEYMNGNASPKDLETMFQLIYLYFTNPRMDSTCFLSYKSRMESMLQNRSSDPNQVFSDTVQWTMAQHNPRMKPFSVEMLDDLDLQKSLEIYKDRFADAGDFTFVFVGSFDIDSIKPLIETYLGGLPSTGREESWRDLGIRPPEGVVKKEVHKGIEPKSSVRIIFNGDYDWNRKNNYNMNSLADVLRIKLREVLREDKGGTYGVGVYPNLSHYPDEEYTFTVAFGCNPERVDELTQAAFAQIDSLKEFGPDTSYINKVVEMQKREREKDLKENRFWIQQLFGYYQNGLDPRLIMDYDNQVKRLNADLIKNTARKYLDDSRYALFELFPEKEAQAEQK